MNARDLIIIGDALKVLKTFPDNVVDCVMTSPPYWGLRDYKIKGQIGLEETLDEYIETLTEVFREVRRVLKDEGILWLNMGDAYCSQPAGNINPSGFSQTRPSRRKHGIGAETVDLPIKDFGNLKPKNLIGQPWRLAFALQIDGWYLRSDIIWAKPNPMPESVQGSGWYRHKVRDKKSKEWIECSGCEKCKDNGGYVLRMNAGRPTKSHEYLFLFTKSAKYYYDAEAIKEPSKYPNDNRKSRSSKNHKRMPTEKIAGVRPGDQTYPTRNKRTVWTIPTQACPEAHFAVFPEKLVEPCILAGTSEKGYCAECGKPIVRIIEKTGGRDWRNDGILSIGIPGERNKGGSNKRGRPTTSLDEVKRTRTIDWKPSCSCRVGTVSGDIIPGLVLDPFMGSGTVAIVAKRLGRDYLGIELSMEYLKIIRGRLFKQLRIKARAIDRR